MPKMKPLIAVVAAPLLMILINESPMSAASQYQMLYAFTGGNDGAIPWDGLVFDSAGNLSATTIAGGAYGYGTAFKLTRGANGDWTETVLHSFKPNSMGGNQPEAGVIFDATGNLYGTTYIGGIHGQGTVFKLAPGSGGTWNETALHAFRGKDGGRPSASLIFDKAGNLYGTTFGIPSHCGNVFKLTSSGAGRWTETVLHDFGPIKNGPNGGCQPAANLIFDSTGNLYGTTSTGGAHIYFGTPSS